MFLSLSKTHIIYTSHERAQRAKIGYICRINIRINVFFIKSTYFNSCTCYTLHTLFQTSIICHEFLHAIGLIHEQQRPDRDSNVRVLLENVIPGSEYNFVRSNPSRVSTLNIPYNYRSIMHYSAYVSSQLTPDYPFKQAKDMDKPISLDN